MKSFDDDLCVRLFLTYLVESFLGGENVAALFSGGTEPYSHDVIRKNVKTPDGDEIFSRRNWFSIPELGESYGRIVSAYNRVLSGLREKPVDLHEAIGLRCEESQDDTSKEELAHFFSSIGNGNAEFFRTFCGLKNPKIQQSVKLFNEADRNFLAPMKEVATSFGSCGRSIRFFHAWFYQTFVESKLWERRSSFSYKRSAYLRLAHINHHVVRTMGLSKIMYFEDLDSGDVYLSSQNEGKIHRHFDEIGKSSFVEFLPSPVMKIISGRVGTSVVFT